MKAFSKVVITLTSVFLVIGLARYAFNGFRADEVGGLLPDADWFMAQFGTFPNIFVELGEIRESYNGVCTADIGGGTAQFWVDLFSVIFHVNTGGNCHASGGAIDVIVTLGMFISYPIRVIIWMMGVFV